MPVFADATQFIIIDRLQVWRIPTIGFSKSCVGSQPRDVLLIAVIKSSSLKLPSLLRLRAAAFPLAAALQSCGLSLHRRTMRSSCRIRVPLVSSVGCRGLIHR
eukprot:scaffold113547_cov27-Tisochrysis_lutea.AAC.1